MDTAGDGTGVSLGIPSGTSADYFTSTNGSGTTASDRYCSEATKDSLYFDNTGSVTRKPKLKLTGLDPDNVYDFNFFGSRTGSGSIRSTKYSVTGNAATKTDVNDATDNTENVAEILDIHPTAGGEINILLEKAPDNSTSSGVGYLNVIEITVTEPN